MRVSDYDNFLNANIIEEFNALNKKGLDPKMAVYNNRIFIYSTNPTTLCEKITAFFQDIIYKILFATGLFNTDPEKIKTLQQSAQDFYLEKSKKLTEGHTQSLKDEIEEKETKLAGLKEKVQDISAQQLKLESSINNLTLALSNKEGEMKSLIEKEEKIQKLLIQHQDLHKKIELLEIKEKSLKEQLQKIEGELQPKEAIIKELNQQTAALKQEIALLKEDSEQLKYKDQCEKLKVVCSKFEAIISKLKTEKENAYKQGKAFGLLQGRSGA